MEDVFIYDERWMNSTEQRLRTQRQQLAELREKLQAVRNASGPEWAVNIAYTLARLERLERSLKKTGDVLEQFQERVETLNRQAISAYGEVLAQSQREFS